MQPNPSTQRPDVILIKLLVKLVQAIVDSNVSGITSGLYKKQFSENFASATTWVASIVARSNVVS